MNENKPFNWFFLRPMSKILIGVIFASKMKNWSWGRVKKNRRYRNITAVFVCISNIKKKQKCLLTKFNILIFLNNLNNIYVVIGNLLTDRHTFYF